MVQVGRTQGFFRGAVRSLGEIWSQRELLGLLVRRELKARYKDSSLGVLWSLVRPLTQLLIYYFAVGQILGVARAVPDFAIFVFVGLTGWTLFIEIVGNGTKSIISNGGLVKKVYLPREIFPLASVGGALFSFAMQFLILITATLVLSRFPLTPDLPYALLGIVLIIVFGTALGILLAGLTVYLRDLEHLVEVILAVLFWASPIVYSYAFVSNAISGTWLEQLYLANPVTVAILGMQKGLWLAGSLAEGGVVWPPDLALRMWIALGVSLVLLWVSQRIFARLQGNFAQEL
ncbi:MAG: sugar ABC transporter [Microbacterium sp.]|nr:sugar ABC transporter [Microbacterium sp.]MBA4346847.1 sugar ABC transporter [Microbacterium sp.]